MQSNKETVGRYFDQIPKVPF